MSITKNTPQDNYTQISNEIITNKELKASAKLVLSALFMLHDNFNVTINGLASTINESHGTVQKNLKILEELGYIKRKQNKKEKGAFSTMDYYVSYKPIYKESDNNNDVVTPQTSFRSTVKWSEYNTIYNNTNYISPECFEDEELNILFDHSGKEKEESGVYDNSLLTKRKCSETYVNNIYNNNIEPEPSDSHKSLLNAKQTKKYKQPGISYHSYSNQELQEYMSKLVDCILHTELDQKKYGKYINDHYANEISKTFSYYYAKYWETYGTRHIIPKMPTMIRCVENFLEPPTSRMNGYDIRDFESYKPMIDKHLDGSFSWNAKTERDVDLTLQHFMTGEIRENLLMRVHHLV